MERRDDLALQRAKSLFAFLRELQRLKERPVADIDAYRSDGDVIWFSALPDHEAVRSVHGRDDAAVDEPWLVVEKVPITDPPAPPQELSDRITQSSLRDLLRDPPLLADRGLEPVWDEEGMEAVEPPDPARATHERWLVDWRRWRDREVALKPVRELYSRLFTIADRLSYSAEELELLVGVGCLSWHAFGHAPVRRHVLTLAADVDFDERSGRLILRPHADAVAPRVELDMLPPSLQPMSDAVAHVQVRAEEILGAYLRRDVTGSVLQQFANVLHPDAQYRDRDQAAEPGDPAVVTFAPALILRRRTSRDLVRIFEHISADLADTGTVPAGIRLLVETVEPSDLADAGADDHPVYLPLAVNGEQLRIVDRVERRPYTVVQGPPGTGKTHTIANLLAHLLARGKRVLVTAQTDRALRELRGKLPGELSKLCVSVVGRERSDLADLRVAVDTLAREAADFDPRRAAQRVEDLEARLGQLERRRSELVRSQLQARAAEIEIHDHAGYRGTLAEIARAREQHRRVHGWINDYRPRLEAPNSPLSDEQALRLLDLLRDAELVAREAEARRALPDLGVLPEPSDFERMVRRAATSAARAAEQGAFRAHPAYAAIARLPSNARTAVRAAMEVTVKEARELAARREPWIALALNDLYQGKTQLWEHRYAQLSAMRDAAQQLLWRVGPAVRVTLTGATPRGQLRAQAVELHQHLAAGGKSRTGMFAPKAVKQAAPLLVEVTVNDLPPDTPERCATAIAWLDLAERLDAADRLWPESVIIPQEDTAHERWAWHQAETHVLATVIDLGRRIVQARQTLSGAGVPQPDWSDLQGVARYGSVVDAVAASDEAEQSAAPVHALADATRAAANSAPNPSPLLADLHTAVAARDVPAYAAVHAETSRLVELRHRLAERDALAEVLKARMPLLAQQLRQDPGATSWDTRFRGLQAAWRWAHTARWIDESVTHDAEEVAGELHTVETEIRRRTTQLTSALAMREAVGRLGAAQVSDLQSYAFAVTKIPKTRTAKTYAERLRVAQGALKKCRGAVPSWVMPLYRIGETLDVERDAFDVVIIDEASQAGVEAAFLQYLAPRIVVVGDDKQVSPSNVGVKIEDLSRLEKLHLADVPHSHIWAYPESSFFDLTRIKFGDVIALREHFRCMPEIIGFSNELVYEPDNVTLIPLRQFGRDRLPPIRTIHVPDGYARGTTTKVNPPEIDTVVELVRKCLTDPEYDGKTFGVISLLGKAQARAIEGRLLAEIDPQDYKARDLRCGDAPDFQGSERDVIVLSAVAGPQPGALTAPAFVQRYNVAASRAKDQMWLVHSFLLSELKGNPEDVRFRLLDYCMKVEARLGDRPDDSHPLHVSEDVLVEPFDSRFEQQVYNAIRARGYRVIPHYPVYGHDIDLVIEGEGSKFAVECDGDHWDGADRFEHDLRRQHELERCGWPFLRVRESLFTVDPGRALQPLWAKLEKCGIWPEGRDSLPPPDAGTSVAGAPPASVPVPPAPSRSTGEGVRRDKFISGEGDMIIRPPEPARPDADAGGHAEAVAYPAAQVPPPPGLGDEDTGELPELPPVPARDDVRAMPAGEVTAEREPVTFFRLAGPYGGLELYQAWDPDGLVRPAQEATLDERIATLVDIVRVEGPIVGERLYQLYVRASGGQRAGKDIKRYLNQATAAAEKRGVLVGSDPLGRAGQLPKTYRLPGQPSVRLRQLGTRGKLSHVPPGELRALLARWRANGLEGEELHRAVLGAYGVRRLTAQMSEYLQAVGRLDVDP